MVVLNTVLSAAALARDKTKFFKVRLTKEQLGDYDALTLKEFLLNEFKI